MAKDFYQTPKKCLARKYEFFANDTAVSKASGVLHEVGLGYLRLSQPATELSGGEAQRIKLGTE